MEKYDFDYLKSGKNFGHSHAVSNGNLIVLSGLVSSSSSDSYSETKDIIYQLNKILISLNLDKYNVLSSNCYVVKIEENFQKFNEALEYYSKAIIIKPNYILAINMRALTYEKLNDLEKALKDYNQIKLLEPSGKYIDGLILLTKAKLCLWNGFGYTLNKCRKKNEKKIIAWEPLISLIFEASLENHKKTLDLFTKDKMSTVGNIFTHIKNNKKKIRLGYFSADRKDI